MPMSRLSVLFDCKLRQSKSSSNLKDHKSTLSTEWGSQNPAKARKSLKVTRDDNSGNNLLPPPAATIPQSRKPRPIGQHRASTTPLMHPPDELFLKMIRRRSESALLEEQLQVGKLRENQESDFALRVAIASALPPIYLEDPPSYNSPANTSDEQDSLPGSESHHAQSWSEPLSPRPQPEGMLLSDTLRTQIDETIAQYASIKLTEPSPTMLNQELTPTISPLNDLDRIYLEKRRQRKRRERVQVPA